MGKNPLWSSCIVAALAVQMSGRILTPNGDGKNDAISFTLPASVADVSRAQVYDVRGRRVADLVMASAGTLLWNGRDSAGRTVQSGMYLVQISAASELWNGVVAVAK